jgi:flagellar hook assembly protein FlgD
VHASHDASVKISIYTVSGRLVKTLGPVAVAPARREAIPWACDDKDGDRVANGVYLYRVEVTSDRTGEKARYEGKVTVRR